jgi:hypothetical protein
MAGAFPDLIRPTGRKIDIAHFSFMKKIPIFVAIATAFFVLTMVSADDRSKPARLDKEVQELKQQVGGLKSEVKTLNQRLDRLQSLLQPRLEPLSPSNPSRPPVVETPKGILPTPDSRQENRNSPKIWGQGEVNGWTFYLIPLSDR